MLMDGPHWEMEPPSELAPFFPALPDLSDGPTVLCLAEGAWRGELKAFLDVNHVTEPGAAEALDVRSRALRCIRCDTSALAELAQLADSHAEPEVAIHLAVMTNGATVLEWFDVPQDPISVSIAVPEARVRRFAQEIGVRYRLTAG